jgi:type VI secretion system secreted protein VgrG
VRFHWDRENDQSMRCRVAQNWAYKNWGGMIIPRIGMEVMVEFLDGDPDRPLVTGSVYNGDAMPPYTLPEHKTKSVFRTNSHQSKRWEDMNELSFEDKEHNEEIFMHAQRDMSLHIDHNETKVVENNAYSRQRNNLMNETGNNRADLVHGDYNISVGIKYLSASSRERHKILNDMRPLANILGEFGKVPQGVGNWNISVENNKSESVQNTSTEIIGGTKVSNVGNDLEVMVGRNHNLDINGSSLEEINEIKRIVVGEKFEIICGNSKLVMDKDGNILICGKNTNIIVSDEVVINGRKISLN